MKIKSLMEKLKGLLDDGSISKDDYIEITACLMIVDVLNLSKDERKDDEHGKGYRRLGD